MQLLLSAEITCNYCFGTSMSKAVRKHAALESSSIILYLVLDTVIAHFLNAVFSHTDERQRSRIHFLLVLI